MRGASRLMDAAMQHTIAGLRREAAGLRGKLAGVRRLAAESGGAAIIQRAAAAISASADLAKRQCRRDVAAAEAESRRLRRVMEQLRGCVRVVARVRPPKEQRRQNGARGNQVLTHGSPSLGVEFLSEGSLGVRV